MGRVARLIPVLAVVAVPFAGAAHPPQVAFKELAGAHYGIVLVDETGGNAVELTRGQPEPSVFGAFSWSPDGSRLVYASQDDDLYLLGGDGGDAIRLTSGGADRYPAWSPDGGRIAYVHDREIWLIAPDGSNSHPLTRNAGTKYAPEWSPDGSRILYARLGQRTSGTFVVDAGTGAVLLHTGDIGGTWSPDGERIAVQTGSGIDVLAADGTARHAVAGAAASGPTWSPDGTMIAFTRAHCTPGFRGLCGAILRSVYVVRADGTGERRLTGPISRGPGSEVDGFPSDDSASPAWWPDGSQLFFFRQSDDAYAMNADGTCEHPFGPENLLLADPAWRPGTEPSVPPLRCVDLRVRATPVGGPVGQRGDARVHVAIENDGNEPPTGVRLTLRLSYGRGEIRPPLPSCRGGSAVECDFDPLPGGATVRLEVRVARPQPIVFHLLASVGAAETDADPASNESFAYVVVSGCDVVGTARADWLVGTPGHDRICGLAGDDVIHGRGGGDTIDGGRGRDTIVAGPGRDVVLGGWGGDRIDARDGERDVIDCGALRDVVYADPVDELTRCERVVR